MTHASVREYVMAIRARYLKASKAEKGLILNEATQVTGYHRKAIIRLLRPKGPQTPSRRGRARVYGPDLIEPLLSASGGLGCHRQGLFSKATPIPAPAHNASPTAR